MLARRPVGEFRHIRRPESAVSARWAPGLALALHQPGAVTESHAAYYRDYQYPPSGLCWASWVSPAWRESRRKTWANFLPCPGCLTPRHRNQCLRRCAPAPWNGKSGSRLRRFAIAAPVPGFAFADHIPFRGMSTVQPGRFKGQKRPGGPARETPGTAVPAQQRQAVQPTGLRRIFRRVLNQMGSIMGNLWRTGGGAYGAHVDFSPLSGAVGAGDGRCG